MTPGQRAFEAMQDLQAIDATIAGAGFKRQAWDKVSGTERSNWEAVAKVARRRTAKVPKELPTVYFVEHVYRRNKRHALKLVEGKRTNSRGRVQLADGSAQYPSYIYSDPRSAVRAFIKRARQNVAHNARSALAYSAEVQRGEALLKTLPRSKRAKKGAKS